MLVVVKWKCLILSKKTKKNWVVNVSKDAVFHGTSSWVCDCGNWTKGDDKRHIPIEKSNREVF